jgi:dTDP-4-amino-4,6-dideoxygalactose transaminase
LSGWTERRRTIAQQYRAGLRDTSVVVPREFDPGHVYHLFPVLSPDRAAFQAHMGNCGVETLIHYPVPITRQPALVPSRPATCPIADRVCGELVSLPMYPTLSDQDVAVVAEAVRSFPVPR